MKKPTWRTAAGTLALLEGVLPVVSTAAEPEFLINPSIGVSAVFEDNIFGSAQNKEEDYILRFSPAIEAEYRGQQLTLQGGYMQNAELFWRHPEINTTRARRHGIGRAQYRASPQMTFGGELSYTESARPNDFNVVTGLGGARARATNFFVGPSLVYRFAPSTSANLAYTYSHDRVVGGISSETYTGLVGLNHRLGARDTGLLNYQYQEFVFGNMDEPVKSHVVTAGDTHAFTEHTSVTVQAGPRFIEESPLAGESTELEVATQFRQLFEKGEYTVGYGKTHSTILNVLGLAETHSVSATAIYFPERMLEFRVRPEYGRSTLGEREARGYRLTFDVAKHLDRAWSVISGYQYTQQEGTLNGIGGDRVVRNVLMIGMVYAPLALARDGTMLLDNRTKLREGLLPRLDIR